MSEQEIAERLRRQEEKIDAIYTSVEKTRRYFMWTLIVSMVVLVLPLIGLVFALPTFLDYYKAIGPSLGL